MMHLNRRVFLSGAAASSVLGSFGTRPSQAQWSPNRKSYDAMYAAVDDLYPVPAINLSQIDRAFLRAEVPYDTAEAPGTVVVDPDLTKLAEQQSQAMAARNKMDHDVKAPLGKRLQAGGYPATVAVENVSAGYHTLAEAFSGWRDSPPHRSNMLKGGVTKMGIAAVYAPNTKYKVFWTLILAAT